MVKQSNSKDHTCPKQRARPKLRAEVLAEMGIHPDSEQVYYEDISEQFLA
jgi:hypothetical protein